MRIVFDSSFLMRIAAKPIKRIETLESLNAEYIVLSAIICELMSLEASKKVMKAKAAKAALNLINTINAKIVEMKGKPIDDLIIEYAIINDAYVATLDSEMKRRLKDKGIGIITLSKDNIIIV